VGIVLPLTIDLAAIVSGDVDISHLVQNLDATDATWYTSRAGSVRRSMIVRARRSMAWT
jgi:hypothetical protein